jgi:hypothetical protein
MKCPKGSARHHRRANAATTAVAKAGDTEAGIRTRASPGNSISIAGIGGGAVMSIASNSERRLPSRGGAKGRLFHSSILSASAALASASEKN